MLIILALGCALSWRSFVVLPRAYDRLEQRGVAATASVRYSFRLVPFREPNYVLTVSFGGRTYSRRYGQRGQFRSLGPDDSVEVLVDPEDPQAFYPVADVHRHRNAGFGLLGCFGLATTLLGVVLIVKGVPQWSAPALVDT
jgi:hypothetical protein